MRHRLPPPPARSACATGATASYARAAAAAVIRPLPPPLRLLSPPQVERQGKRRRAYVRHALPRAAGALAGAFSATSVHTKPRTPTPATCSGATTRSPLQVRARATGRVMRTRHLREPRRLNYHCPADTALALLRWISAGSVSPPKRCHWSRGLRCGFGATSFPFDYVVICTCKCLYQCIAFADVVGLGCHPGLSLHFFPYAAHFLRRGCRWLLRPRAAPQCCVTRIGLSWLSAIRAQCNVRCSHRSKRWL